MHHGVTTSVGICVDSGGRGVHSILSNLEEGISVCMLSTRWPASSIDESMEALGIRHVISCRKDLKTRTLEPNVLETKKIDHYDLSKVSSQVGTMIFTSGSSAQPKAVFHSIRHHLYSAHRVAEELKLGPQDRWLLSLPLWHVSGISIVFRCLIAGAEVVIPDSHMPLLESLSQYKITHVSLVSTQLLQVMDTSPPDCLRVAIVGGGPISHQMIDAARYHGWPILTTYGMTETSSMVALSDEQSDPRSSGRVLQGHELMIASDQEILVRSPSVCSGYLSGSQLKSVVDEDGWYHSGDLGEMDQSGNLYVLGRKDYMFISGGENISPEEIQSWINNYPDVLESIVIPIPDPTFGHRPVAFIRGPVSMESISEYLAEHLPKFKVPVLYPWPENVISHLGKYGRETFIQLAIDLQEKS
ncbi:MAG: o-succinylbenzoate--CoA ligase [Bacteroidetes bacterium]|nr:o-succinylbenzoate--CoA ligase [Bacteroidota bacterium]